jgi:hypothetical protein
MITIEQVIEDIKSGKSKAIFLSSRTLWWTHLESDLKDSTKAGRQYQDAVHERVMNDPNVPEAEKQRIRLLKAQLVNTRKEVAKEVAEVGETGIMFTVPLDPIGAPLLQNDDPLLFMEQTMSKPSHFGKHGLRAFMLTHHQNCATHFYDKWARYNDLLDLQDSAAKNKA